MAKNFTFKITQIVVVIFLTFFSNSRLAQGQVCGEIFTGPRNCTCSDSAGQPKQPESMGGGEYCCGWYDPTSTGANRCKASQFAYGCGSTLILSNGQQPADQCGCGGNSWFISEAGVDTSIHCCGYFNDRATNNCSPTLVRNSRCFDRSGCGLCDDPTQYCTVRNNLSTCTTFPGQCGAPETPVPPPGGGDTPIPPPAEPENALDIFAGPNAATFRALNPLRMFNSPYADTFTSPAGVINRALIFAYPLAGLILFVMIVWGGFEMVTGATSSKSMQAGQQRITAALIGIGLLFVSFWIIQIVEYIFNIAVL